MMLFKDSLIEANKSIQKLIEMGGQLDDDVRDEISYLHGIIANLDLSIIPIDSIGSSRTMVVTVNQQVDEMWDAIDNNWDLSSLDYQIAIRGLIFDVEWNCSTYESLLSMSKDFVEDFEVQADLKKRKEATKEEEATRYDETDEM